MALVSLGQEVIEPAQVRRRHLDVAHRLGLLRPIQGQRDVTRALAHAQQDGFDVEAFRTAAPLDGPLHLLDGMLLQ